MKARDPIAILLTVALGAVLVYSLWRDGPAEAHTSPPAAMAPRPAVPPPSPLAVPLDGAPGQSVADLAAPGSGDRLELTPEQRRRIAHIMAELHRECADVMRRGVAQWEEAGGFRAGAPPDFSDQASPYGQVVEGLRRAAEQRVLAVLTAEQRRRAAAEAEAPRIMTSPARIACPPVAAYR